MSKGYTERAMSFLFSMACLGLDTLSGYPLLAA
jgi:hypothetical protein